MPSRKAKTTSRKAKRKAVKSPKPAVNPEHVARLAYELYIRRGCEHGRDLDDWLVAERLLLAEEKRGKGKRVADERVRLEDRFSSR